MDPAPSHRLDSSDRRPGASRLAFDPHPAPGLSQVRASACCDPPFFEQYKSTLSSARSIPTPGRWPASTIRSRRTTFSISTGKATGSIPFAGLPRDYTAAVAKFGKKRIDENGTVPWRVEEMYGNLRRAFESYRTSWPVRPQ